MSDTGTSTSHFSQTNFAYIVCHNFPVRFVLRPIGAFALVRTMSPSPIGDFEPPHDLHATLI